MTDIDQVLNERAKSHGDYPTHAYFTQKIKAVFREARAYERMQAHQLETLDMIAHKIGRILAGDPGHADHWVDIQGYAALTAKEIE